MPAGYTAIYTVDDLKAINGSSDKFILMNDLDLSGEDWVSINSFIGVLDGNGHTINNLTSTTGGLFDALAGEIKNLGLENVNIESIYDAGAIANCTDYGYYKETIIQNCYVKGTVSNNSGSHMDTAAGFIGVQGGDVTIENSYFSGNVSSTCYAGGFAGYDGGDGGVITIKNSYVTGNISCVYNAGGFVARQKSGNVVIESSYSNATLSSSDGSIGLVYCDCDSTTITNSYWDIEKSGATYAGYDENYGAIGLTTAEMKNSANFAGWDTDVWDFSLGRPLLKNLGGQPGMDMSTGGNEIRFQIGANSDANTNALTIDTGFSLGDLGLDFSSADACVDSIAVIDKALKIISKKTSDIGATQNRLDSVLASQSTQIENYTSAYSTIMDSDVAEESANFVQAQILQQTTSSLLSQAQSIQASVILNIIRSLE